MEARRGEKIPNFHETNESVEGTTFTDIISFENLPNGCQFICRKSLQLIVRSGKKKSKKYLWDFPFILNFLWRFRGGMLLGGDCVGFLFVGLALVLGFFCCCFEVANATLQQRAG